MYYFSMACSLPKIFSLGIFSRISLFGCVEFMDTQFNKYATFYVYNWSTSTQLRFDFEEILAEGFNYTYI